MFTLADFVAFLRGINAPERAVYLIEKYPADVEPFLPKIYARLVAKGMIQPDAPAVSDASLTADERALIPYLRDLDQVLREGGHDAAMARLRQHMQDPTARELFRKAAA